MTSEIIQKIKGTDPLDFAKTLVKAFIPIGVLIIIATSFSHDKGSLIGNTVGYYVTIIGVAISAVLLLKSRVGTGDNMLNVQHGIQILILLGALMFNVVCVNLYMDDIVNKSIPYYGQFSLISSMLAIVQLYLIFGTANTRASIMLGYLVGSIHLIVVTTIYIILRF